MTRKEAQKALEEFGKLFEPRLRDAFLSAIRAIVDTVLLRDLVEYIARGDIDAAFHSLGLTDAALRPLTAALAEAYETGGVLTAATYPTHVNMTGGRAVFRFDVRNARAERWLREHSATLVKAITEQTRHNVREVITDGMVAGRNPRSVALEIVGRVDATGRRSGGLVGLTANQEGWVKSARRRLTDLDERYFEMELRDKRFDRTVRKAIDKGEPLSNDVIDTLVGRYRDNALKHRGDTIARTEAMQSLNASEYEAHRQLVDTGGAPASAIVREWDSSGDGRVRNTHRHLDGQQRPVDQPFVSVRGDKLMFPGDTSLGARPSETIMCRCRVKSVIDWSFGLTDLPKKAS